LRQADYGDFYLVGLSMSRLKVISVELEHGERSLPQWADAPGTYVGGIAPMDLELTRCTAIGDRIFSGRIEFEPRFADLELSVEACGISARTIHRPFKILLGRFGLGAPPCGGRPAGSRPSPSAQSPRFAFLADSTTARISVGQQADLA
jgi:hypothetical protein